MSPLLARAAAGSLTGQLVARPRSRVVHVACATARQLTPGGRLRRGARPVCGQHGRAWPLTDTAGACRRALCRRCAHVLEPLVSQDDLAAAAARLLTEPELRTALEQARDARELHEAKMLVIGSGPGLLHRLAPDVRAARGRLGLDTRQAS